MTRPIRVTAADMHNCRTAPGAAGGGRPARSIEQVAEGRLKAATQAGLPGVATAQAAPAIGGGVLGEVVVHHAVHSRRRPLAANP